MPLIIEIPAEARDPFLDYLSEKHIDFDELEEMKFSGVDVLLSIIVPSTLSAAQVVAQYLIQKHIPPPTGGRTMRAYLDGRELDLSKTQAPSLPEMVKADQTEAGPTNHPHH